MRRPLCLLVFGLALAACSGEDAEPADSGVAVDTGVAADTGVAPDSGVTADAGVEMDAGELDAGPAPATWTEVQAILRTSCSPCHDPGNQRNRTVVREYANIVNMNSGAFPLVVPSDSAGSFLYAKVTGETAAYCTDRGAPTRNCGGIMPTVRDGTPLTADEVEQIRSWIDDGALEN